MTKNIGETDKAFRIVFGLAILAITFIGPKTLWGLLGFIPLITGLVNFCPLYSLMGINTCSLEHRK
jgi:hypothetical protein